MLDGEIMHSVITKCSLKIENVLAHLYYSQSTQGSALMKVCDNEAEQYDVKCKQTWR